MATKGSAHRRPRRQRRRSATEQRVAARPPAPRHPEREAVTKVLFHLVWPLAVGVIVGLEFWAPARVLLVPGGALLVLFGVLVAAGTIPAHQSDAHPVLVVFVAGLIGLAAIGFGLESVDEPRPWSVLMLPAIVVGGVWCLRVGLSRRESSAVLRRAADHAWGPPWAARAGFIMFGLAWPWFGLVVLGLAELD